MKFKKDISSGITTTGDIDIMEILYAPLKPEEKRKLQLERFRAEGIDGDLKDPVKRYKQIVADLRYLGNAGFANFGKEGAWEEWSKEDILKYFAACIDALRSVYIPLVSPTDEKLYKIAHPDKDPEEAKKTSYWKCYDESKRYMNSKPPENEEELKEWKKKRKELLEDLEKQEEKDLENKEEVDFLNIRADKLQDMTDKQLRNLHQEGHYYWQLHEEGKLKDVELLINNHVLVAQELIRRDLKHSDVSGLDSLSGKFFPGYDKKGFSLLFEHEQIHQEYQDEPCELLFLQHMDSEKALMKSGYRHMDHSDELDKYYVWHNEHELARVNPSGEVKGRRILLEEVLGYLKKGFRIRSPYVYLTGGVCLAADSVILSNPSSKYIFENPQQVLDSAGVFSKVKTWFIRDYKGQIVEINPFYIPPLSLTPEHKIFVWRTKPCRHKSARCRPNCKIECRYKKEILDSSYLAQIPAKEATKFDYVLYPKEVLKNKEFLFDLSKMILNEKKQTQGHRVRFKVGSKKITNPYLRDQNRFIKLDENFAKLAGLYIAEGNSVRNSWVRFSFGFQEKELAEELLKLGEKIFGFKGIILPDEKKSTLSIQFNSSLLARFFKLHFGSALKFKRLPPFLFSAKENIIKSFLRGFILGDGCLSRDRTEVPISTASKTLVFSLFRLCLLCHIVPSFHKARVSENRFSKKPIYGFSFCGVASEMLFKNFFKKRRAWNKQIWFEDKKYYYFPIKSISEKPYSGKVFNIETEDGSYVSSFLVSNCNNGSTSNDIEIVVQCTQNELDSRQGHLLKWRIMRMFPPDLARRLHFLPATHIGPVTNNIPLYALSCERINENDDIFEMSIDEDSFEIRKALLRAKAPKAERQAQKAKKADKITLGEFFLAMKPTRGYFPEVRSTPDGFVKFFEDKDYPVYSSKKVDGARVIFHKINDKVLAWSEDGLRAENQLPKISKAVKKLNAKECILDTEVESWIGDVHFPREKAAGILHSKAIDDDSLIANAFDILWYNGKDLHKQPYEERLIILKKINFPQSTEGVPDVKKRLNFLPHHLNKNRAELRKETERLRKLPASEGNVAKNGDFIFNLSGKRSGEIKFHNNAMITVSVIKKIPTKVSGVSNYQYGVLVGGEKVSEARIAEVDAKKYYAVGKTFSTARAMKPGDKFHLEFETLNATRNQETDEIRISCWVPRFIETTDDAVDTIDSAMRKAKKERVLQLKEITEEGKTIYKMLGEEDIFEKALTYEDVPDEDQKSKFMIHLHSRGKSLHSDFRVEAKDKKYIVGFTLDDSIEGAIKEPILTMSQGKALLKRDDISKINWKTGKFKMRRTAANTIVPTQIRSQEKKPAPKEWLGIEGVVPKGSVGATKEFPGVFVIRDKGIAEFGTVKSYFKEFFLDGQHLKGRLVFRQLTPWTTKELNNDFEKILPPSKGEEIERTGIWWSTIQPIDQLPYVLSDRAVKKAWIPPANFSALPRHLKSKVPAEFHYWTKSSEKERIKIRDAYVEWLKEKDKYDELKKSFDVREIEAEPREFNYWVMKEFLDCKLKDVFANSVFIPQPKIGNFLKAFQEMTKDYQVLDTRNFDKRGCESPPVYQMVQLNSKKEEDFLVEGMRFLENKLVQRFIASFFPTYGGLDFTLVSNTIFKSLNKDLVRKAFDWVKENNFLKGEKFTLGGEFLKSPEGLSWDELKLDKTLKDNLLRINKSINEEGKNFSRGLLMIGLPGTGKTFSCKLLMKDANSTFIWVTAKEFSSNALGMAFDLARELSPSILCFEDIDTYIGGHCVDLFKTELDGLVANEGVCVILTTNHPENLPLALLDRPGRFHDICNFELPDSSVRQEMISHFAKEEIGPETMRHLVKETEEFSGAHIRELVSFAKRIQVERECGLDEAFFSSLEKLKKQKNLVTEILEGKEKASQPFRLDFSKSDEIGKLSEKDAKWVLQSHVWRGPKVIREGWSDQHWDLRIDISKPDLIHFVLWKNPLENKEISGILKPCQDKKSMTVEYKPPPRGASYSEYKRLSIPFGTPLNETKETPAFIWALDRGDAIVLENTDIFKKIQFKGKKLKGVWAFIREDPKAKMWRMEYSAVPEPKKEIDELHPQFIKEIEDSLKSGEIEPVYKVEA